MYIAPYAELQRTVSYWDALDRLLVCLNITLLSISSPNVNGFPEFFTYIFHGRINRYDKYAMAWAPAPGARSVAAKIIGDSNFVCTLLSKIL